MDAVLELADLAAEQWGLVTAAQARAVGVSNQMAARLTERGTLERLAYGVYRVSGAPAGPLDGLRAAWLALEPARRAVERTQDATPIVVSHRAAAAAVYGYGDLDGDVYEFTAPSRRQSRRTDVRFHRAVVEPGDWAVVDGLPVTTPERTIVDLAAARIDGGHLAGVVRDAVMGFDVDENELAQRLRPYAHHYGAPLGDGAQMIQLLLDQAGVEASPQLTAAALKALTSSIDTSAFASANAPALESLSRAFARANPTAMQSMARILEQSNPTAMQSLARMAAQANPPAMESVKRILGEMNRPAFDAARKALATTSPVFPKMSNTPKFPKIDAGTYSALEKAVRLARSTSWPTAPSDDEAEPSDAADSAGESE